MKICTSCGCLSRSGYLCVQKDSQVPAAGPKGQVAQPVKKAVPIPKKASQISANWKLLSKVLEGL